MGQMVLREMTAMFTIAVFMVLGRFAPLKSRCEVILMVRFFSLLPDFSHKALSVLVNNLRVHVKPMFRLYLILKDRDKPPTPKEIDIASAKQQVDGEYLQMLEKSSENIKKAFQNQQARALVSKSVLAVYRLL